MPLDIANREALLAAASGTSLGAHTGARVGRVADRVVGTNVPGVMRAAPKAEAVLIARRKAAETPKGRREAEAVLTAKRRKDARR